MNFFSFFLIKVHSSQSLQSTGNTTQEVEIDFDEGTYVDPLST